MSSRNGRRSRQRRMVLVALLLIALMMVYVLYTPKGDRSRSPIPTPVNENVHEIAP